MGAGAGTRYDCFNNYCNPQATVAKKNIGTPGHVTAHTKYILLKTLKIKHESGSARDYRKGIVLPRLSAKMTPPWRRRTKTRKNCRLPAQTGSLVITMEERIWQLGGLRM